MCAAGRGPHGGPYLTHGMRVSGDDGGDGRPVQRFHDLVARQGQVAAHKPTKEFTSTPISTRGHATKESPGFTSKLTEECNLLVSGNAPPVKLMRRSAQLFGLTLPVVQLLYRAEARWRKDKLT